MSWEVLHGTIGPWLEVFDPRLKKWVGLSSDPFINTAPDSCFMSVLLEDPKILLFFFYHGQVYCNALLLCLWASILKKIYFPFLSEAVSL